MKRITALLFSLLLMITPAFAEGIDIESMDLTALFALREKIDNRIQELVTDSYANSIVYQGGVYIVGTDIQPGKYLLHCNLSRNDPNRSDFYCTVYDGPSWRESEKRMSQECNAGETVLIELEEGMTFEVELGQAVIRKFTPLQIP